MLFWPKRIHVAWLDNIISMILWGWREDMSLHIVSLCVHLLAPLSQSSTLYRGFGGIVCRFSGHKAYGQWGRIGL